MKDNYYAPLKLEAERGYPLSGVPGGEEEIERARTSNLTKKNGRDPKERGVSLQSPEKSDGPEIRSQ